MRVMLPFVVVFCGSLASAQDFVSKEQIYSVKDAAKSTLILRDLWMPLPAPVDPGPVKALFERLARDGERVEMEQAIGNAYTRQGRPDAHGRFQNLQAVLVEVPREFEDKSDDPIFHYAVMRRVFSHLEVTTENWNVDPVTGKGKLHVWSYRLSLDGDLLSVEHQIAPVEPGSDGKAAPIEAKARGYRRSPSDPSVQRRWKRLAEELLTLGRVTKT
ncbi:MAG TPA: hypothetical protein DCZ01_10305 [Elusimicrobia bacterium]|nr:MAG: hypothetical protein A2X37_00815 [Elusimicrobia bacterium GWA2_66_18]OGR72376.1 MAG: hypothetical protein A2X40_04475 [Elusimicrobia bacterium GWC2_65_9]HAZ08890.1 hypothetical protein [Elusimicrobiota bacterium]